MNVLQRARIKLLPHIARLMLRPRGRDDLVRLGGGGGSWVVPQRLFDANSICYCVGVGEDVSFDLELIERFGCQVYAFDPTPKAIAHVRQNCAAQPHFHFEPVGVWKDDCIMKFFVPRNPQHASYSIANLQQTDEFVEAPCKRLSTLMREHGHTRIDLLKIDVEGAEYDVIDSMLAERIRPRVFCLEFDQPAPFARTKAAVRRLVGAGFQLVHIQGWNYTFVAPEP